MRANKVREERIKQLTEYYEVQRMNDKLGLPIDPIPPPSLAFQSMFDDGDVGSDVCFDGKSIHHGEQHRKGPGRPAGPVGPNKIKFTASKSPVFKEMRLARPEDQS